MESEQIMTNRGDSAESEDEGGELHDGRSVGA